MHHAATRQAPRRLPIYAAVLGCFTLYAAQASAQTESAQPDDVQSVTITAKRDEAETSFKATRSDTTTRGGAELREVPESVTIITSKVLETQQALSIREALRNVSGISFFETPQGMPSYSIRGYSETSSTSNGVTDRAAAQTNVFGVERVEVLKGPQAILAGAGSLGGGVNVVTKKPQASTIRDLTLQYGSHGDATAALDLSGAITADQQLSYRLIGAKSKADHNYAGYDGREEDFLLPELRWKDQRTDLIVGLSYGKQHLPVTQYTFARRDGTIMPVPDMLLSNPGDGFDSQQQRVFYDLNTRLGAGLILVSRAQRVLSEENLHLYSPSGLLYASGAASNNPRGTSLFYAAYSPATTRTTSGDHYLQTLLASGPVEHSLALGFNHSDYYYDQTQRDGLTITGTLYPNAVPVAFPDAISAATVTELLAHSHQRQKAIYAQDLLSYGKWNLLLNVRRTLVSSDGVNVFPTVNFVSPTPSTTSGKTTPGAGLVYNVNDATSVYASFADGFAAQAVNLCDGNLAPPLSTRNKEVGAKFDLLDKKLALTASAFKLLQSNKLLYNTSSRCYTVRDAQETRGIELDLQGELAQGWNAIVNTSYYNYRDVGSATTPFPGLPRNKASVWTTYDFQQPAWKGLGVGFGITAAGHSDGSNSTSYQFKLPGQAQMDASVYYHSGKWDITAGVKNLADRLLYGVSSANAYIPVLDGRNYMLTVRRSFN